MNKEELYWLLEFIFRQSEIVIQLKVNIKMLNDHLKLSKSDNISFSQDYVDNLYNRIETENSFLYNAIKSIEWRKYYLLDIGYPEVLFKGLI